MLNLSPRANLTKLLEEGQQLCSRSWANSSRISRTPNYGGQYCFWVPYMASLVEDALCLGAKEIIFGPGDVSWTLGAALVEDEKLFSRTTQAHTSISIFKNMEIMSSPVLLFVLLLCLLFILYWTKIKLPLPSKKVAATGESLPSYGQAKHRPN